MAQLSYEKHLGDSNFIKYGIVCSSFVWNKTYAEIETAFRISKSYISQVLSRWEDADKFSDRRASNGGSNKKLSKTKQDTMRDLIEENRGTSIRQIASRIEEEFKIAVTQECVNNTLKEMGFKKSFPIKVPFLSPSAIEKRLEYATKHLEDQFNNVCFTDECVFQLSENRQLFWWNPKEEERPIFEASHDKRKIMIWGGISRKGKTDLYYWKLSKDLSVNAEEYTECINETLIDRMDGLYGVNKWRLMQDNARPHTATSTRDFLEDNDIRTIKHPPYSPDLNPIELVWAYLKRKVMVKEYKNLDEVLDAITDEWYDIPMEMIRNLIDRHILMVQKVYDLEGKFDKNL